MKTIIFTFTYDNGKYHFKTRHADVIQKDIVVGTSHFIMRIMREITEKYNKLGYEVLFEVD